MTAILGAGISGLSAAYYALNNPKITSLVVLEASNRVGGWIRSLKQPNGTIFEKGPRVIRTKPVNVINLAEELQLSDKIIRIKRDHPVTKQRYIYSDNTLHCLPLGFKSVFTKNTLLNRSLIRVLCNDFIAAKVPKDDESIHDFIQRRFGKDVSEKLVAPIFCGIFGGDTHQLSAKSCLKDSFEAEQTHGSIFKGLLLNSISKVRNIPIESTPDSKNNVKLPDIYSQLSQRPVKERERTQFWGIEGGFEQLPQALANNISRRGVNIKLQHKCEKIIFNKDHVELIVNGKSEKCSRIISSLPAKNLATLIQEQHPDLSKELCSIPTVTMVVINLQYSENVLSLNTFGVLVAPKEKIPILGVLFDSCIVPQNSKKTVLTVMMGGAWFEKYFGESSSEEHLKTVAIKGVSKILGIAEDPKAINISILRDCIPQYTIGHAQRLTRIHEYISTHKIPLVLCGSSYQGVGVPDVILSAKRAVSDIS